MGLFMDPRRQPDDTRRSYNRRRAPWLVLVALGCSIYVLSRGYPSYSGWLAMMVTWLAAIMSIMSADWSDLRRK
ncbi:hypothetical protein CDO44_26220 [Pigmentiphaga sp. NML080357]|uniref:hypothetical protein n=1 Tax=Pigmentiphaga sp. NML080357 TaxID=2008675 RepID=UPI000B41CD49|nr:hypothetical protein [Pigmentiphaga sp. NML080357]OVZ54253.1 hypothetical protein CDO44_26220 [Pigmentiphaga sp. NML080357]